MQNEKITVTHMTVKDLKKRLKDDLLSRTQARLEELKIKLKSANTENNENLHFVNKQLQELKTLSDNKLHNQLTNRTKNLLQKDENNLKIYMQEYDNTLKEYEKYKDNYDLFIKDNEALIDSQKTDDGTKKALKEEYLNKTFFEKRMKSIQEYLDNFNNVVMPKFKESIAIHKNFLEKLATDDIKNIRKEAINQKKLSRNHVKELIRQNSITLNYIATASCKISFKSTISLEDASQIGILTHA